MDEITKREVAEIEDLEYAVEAANITLAEARAALARRVLKYKKDRSFSPNSGINRETGEEVKNARNLGAAPRPLPPGAGAPAPR